MSFLCPSVGLLKFRKFTKFGVQPSRSKGTRAKVRNRGTSVSFERAGSDLSIASQGGFSALYGEVNPAGQTEVGGHDEVSASDGEEYFAGIYVGGGDRGDAGNARKSVMDVYVPNSEKLPGETYLAQDPATVQSFTFFEETMASSGHNEFDAEEEDRIDDGKTAEEKTPLLNHSSPGKELTSPRRSGGSRARYNLPNWVRQRRCLPTLNDVDFDKIDAISLGSLSISSETDIGDNNNNIASGGRGCNEKYPKSNGKRPSVTVVKNSPAKRTHSDDLCDDEVPNQNPHHQHLQTQRDKLVQDARVISLYSPKKTKRSESETTDDSVFVREKVHHQQLRSPLNPRPQLKIGTAKTSSRLRKSPSMDSLRRRSKKRESALKGKQESASGSARSKVSARSTNGTEDARVGNLVRTKPLYMRATSERALDPSEIKLRMQSSTARKWRQNGERSPLSEVTNVSHPQSSMCLRMEIVQRPVIHGDTTTMSPRATGHHRDSVKLPAGKIRPVPQRCKPGNSTDHHDGRRRASFRRKLADVKTNPPPPANIGVKEEQIDAIFHNNELINPRHRDGGKEKMDNFRIDEHFSNHGEQPNKISSDYVPDSNQLKTGINSDETRQQVAPLEDRLPTVMETNFPEWQVLSPKENGDEKFPRGDTLSSHQVAEVGRSDPNTESEPMGTDFEHQPPKRLVYKPKFADNSIKEARIVSTAKMADDAIPEDDATPPPLPPKMTKSASFAGPSHEADAAKSTSSSSKTVTRSATNVRALQTPLTQQQRRKLRRNAPGNKNRSAHRISAVEASREDIVEVVAAMKASLDSTKLKTGNIKRLATGFVKKSFGEAVVVYDFEARNEDDVNVKIGDVVTVLNKDDPDWLFVKKHSGGQEEGLVPRIFLQLTAIKEESGQSLTSSAVPTSQDNSMNYVAMTDNQRETSSLKTISEKRSVLNITQRLPHPNPKSLNHQPMMSSDDSLAQSAHAQLKTTDQSRGDIGKMDGKRDRPAGQSKPGKNSDLFRSRPQAAVPAHKFNTNKRGAAGAVVIETYVVLNDYTRQDHDEVDVVEGEVIVVNSAKQQELDWMWVYVPRTDKFGFVPAFNARPLGFHYSDV